VSRSAKFEAMFSSVMKEGEADELVIECKRPELYKLMLTWIYCGEIKFPEDVFDIFDLMKLADEYIINDLK
jgi:speckle-type POZ protein